MSYKPHNLDLVDNHVYEYDPHGPVYYLRDRTDPRRLPVWLHEEGKRSWSRWDRCDVWTRLACRVEEAYCDPNRHGVVIRDDDGYSHDTHDSFLRVSSSFKDGVPGYVVETGNLIGTVRSRPHGDSKCGSGTVTIGSRFGDMFLKYIIADADGFVWAEGLGGTRTDGDGFDWLLGYLWNMRLRAAGRIGLPKGYDEKNERLPCVRGKVDPLDSLAYAQRGKVLCNYRELGYDTPAAALFVAAWKSLNARDSTRFFCRSTVGIYQSLVRACFGRRSVPRSLLSVKPFANPLYAEYNRVISLSKQVLKRHGCEFGEDDEFDALLFDVSMLFEYYVRKLLVRSGFRLEPKEQHPFSVPTCPLSGDYARNLIPDLVFKVGGGVGILDAKYKSYDNTGGVSRDDVFQLHTYIGQYGNIHDVRLCGFVYPIPERKWIEHRADARSFIISSELKQQGRRIPFVVCFLVVPDAPMHPPVGGESSGGQAAYEEFCRKMKANADALVDQLKAFVNKNCRKTA